MSERGFGARHDVHRVGWEVSEFPILCETCLGSTPYLRMTRADFDKECKVCTRPFIVFRWKPGNNARFKKTEVCQTCAKVKNVCQTCLLDLQFGLPVEVRDKFLTEKIEVPKDVVNKNFWAHQMTNNIEKLDLPYGKEDAYPVLEKLKHDPNPKRNLPHICSFFVKGNCARSEGCPYRHEIPDINNITQQNFKDRYYGVNDPVAKKILRGYGGDKPPVAPADRRITTLYIGGLTDDSISEKDLMNIFGIFGDIKNVKIMLKNYCAFINFLEREGAENAINSMFNKLIIKGVRYTLKWGKLNFDVNKPDNENISKVKEVQYKTEMPSVKTDGLSILNVYDEDYKPYYPSMDPKAMGGELKSKKKLKTEDKKNTESTGLSKIGLYN